MPVWDDVIGSGDRASFAKGYSPEEYVGFGERPAVLVVDMCRSFVEDGYPTGNSRHGRPTAAAIARLLAVAREVGVPVLYTTYSAREFSFGWARWKGKALSDPSMHSETAFEIVPELAPRPDERVIVKTMPSGFFGTPLASLLTFLGVDTCIVTGMVTSGCVRATVVDAFSNNFRVVVPEECVADRGELSHKVNLFDIHMKYGDVRPLADVLAHLRRAPRPAAAAVGAAAPATR
jgi:nicotinamidase-related amidase